MRAMPIQVFTGFTGLRQMKAAFLKNWKHYLQEALGLGIFMVSACFFSVLLFAPSGNWYHAIPNEMTRHFLMGLLMGSTALFIFYSPLTAPSGSQINPAVTLTFLRLGRMCRYDALFFMLFQLAGGTIAVFLMQWWMGPVLTEAPVHSAATVPGKYGPWWALLTEFVIAFITMSVVLFSSSSNTLKKYTRLFSGCLVCAWVIIAGPISGFGMNPARSFASAVSSGTWTAFPIYFITPLAGMLSAAQVYQLRQKNRKEVFTAETKATVAHKKKMNPLEFVL